MTLLVSCSARKDCPDKANLLPMFSGLKKCDEQIKIDNDFIADCNKYFKDRKEATRYHIDRGWEYFFKNDLDTAMMRFNQAWLLDSTNADVYWGFGNILGRQQKFQESLKYFDKSLAINSGNSKVWLCSATSYGQLTACYSYFMQKDSARKYLAITDRLDPKAINPEVRQILNDK